jgi:putative endopeptidase
MRSFRLALLAAAALSAPLLAQTPTHPTTPQAVAMPKIGTWGVDYAAMDKSVKPGDDFFAYSVGTWLKTTEIAPDRSSASNFTTLADGAENDVRRIVESASASRATPLEQQVGDMYAAWMDEAGIEARGLAPLQPYMARIAAVKNRHQLVLLMADPGFAMPIDINIGPDAKDPTIYTVGADQGELGLPSKEYYQSKDAKYVEFRKAYSDYIAKLFDLAGIKGGKAKAAQILALETRLAADHWDPEQLRDPVKTYNPMDRAALSKLAPAFDWAAVLARLGLEKMPIVVVGEPSAIQAAGKRLQDVPLATWKNYLSFRFLSDHADYLPHAFDSAHFDFYAHTLKDVKEQRERWKRGVNLLDSALGEAVGQLYVAKHWSSDTDAKVKEMIEDLRTAYKMKIDNAKWMDEETRTQALLKLASFEPRVGHPEKYVDYSAFKVSATDPLANEMSGEVFQWNLRLSRLGKPVDRSLWHMNPQTSNAYYNPQMNQITFPAAILQAPFFDAAADPAVNYAEAGAIIGHEMGHGFDDEGRQFDAKGVLRDWWSKGTAAKYVANTNRIVDQFNAYEPIPGVHVKGKLTLGENLADLGGMETAYTAYQLYQQRHGKAPLIDGMTGEQRFFLAHGQSWEGKRREGALRALVLTNPHSPEKYRINGIVRNMAEWYEAFGVKAGDALWLDPKDRVHVW